MPGLAPDISRVKNSLPISLEDWRVRQSHLQRGYVSLTEHDSTGAVVCIEKRDPHGSVWGKFNIRRRIQGQSFLRGVSRES